MSKRTLHCRRCGREYTPSEDATGASLACRACGSPLQAEPPENVEQRENPFDGATVAGARLKKLLAERPTRFVYRARHKGMSRTVRMELFTPEFGDGNPDFMRRLFAGAARTQQVRSVHVATVLDLARLEECYYVMSEYFPSDLRRLLEKKGRLSVQRTLRLAERLLRGLQAVRKSGAVHGNVTPQGVLIGYDDRVRLDHLGTALRPEDLQRLTLTEEGRVRGPCHYRAPERSEAGREGDIRSDLYSLGCVLYEALGGRPPYTGRSAEEVLRKHDEGGAPDLRALREELPPALCSFVRRLTARRPADRPAGPGDALEELEQLAVELSEAGAIGPVRAALRGVRRWKFDVTWTSAWTVVALLLVAGIVVPFFMTCRMRERRRQARLQAVEQQEGRVAVMVRLADPKVADPLPEEHRLAMLGMMRYRLAFYPELQAADRRLMRRLEEGTETVEELRREAGADHVLVAAHEPGFERRNWTLVFTSYRGEPWSEVAETQTEEGAALGEVEQALREALRKAAARLDLSPPDAADDPVVNADAAAWAELERALAAERRDEWTAALQHVRRARQSAPRAAPFAAAEAFYEAVHRADTGKGLAPGTPPPPGGLPPEWAGVAAVLRAAAAGDEEAVLERMADLLAAQQRSVRGYFLLGMWRLHVQNRPREALPNFRYAAALDSGYLPAVRRCLRLMARLEPDRLDAYVAEYAEKQRNEDLVLRVRDFAQRVRRTEQPPQKAAREPAQ